MVFLQAMGLPSYRKIPLCQSEKQQLQLETRKAAFLIDFKFSQEDWQ